MGNLALQRSRQVDLGERRVGRDQAIEIGDVAAVMAVVVEHHHAGAQPQEQQANRAEQAGPLQIGPCSWLQPRQIGKSEAA